MSKDLDLDYLLWLRGRRKWFLVDIAEGLDYLVDPGSWGGSTRGDEGLRVSRVVLHHFQNKDISSSLPVFLIISVVKAFSQNTIIKFQL